MTKQTLTADERDAVWIILSHCAPEMATIIAMHEDGCYLRSALNICLRVAGMTKDQLLEIWVGQAVSGE